MLMAEAVVDWVRQSVAPQVLALGSSLTAVEISLHSIAAAGTALQARKFPNAARPMR
jgi:hypothetical protein